jgi:hypothetical protein
MLLQHVSFQGIEPNPEAAKVFFEAIKQWIAEEEH